jgi:molybdopterin synthase catalytic subunit
MRERWDVRKVAIAHRTGLVPVGEASVIIAVSSAHRREALEATQFGIEELKARARSVWFACACAV